RKSGRNRHHDDGSRQASESRWSVCHFENPNSLKVDADESSPFVGSRRTAYDRSGKALVYPFYGMVGAVVTDDRYDLAGIRFASWPAMLQRALKRFERQEIPASSGFEMRFWI